MKALSFVDFHFSDTTSIPGPQVFKSALSSLKMHPLTLVLAVPLFCTFGVSLPYQDEGFTDGYGNGLDNALELPNGDSSFKWNPEFSDLLGGGGLQATLPLSTDSDTSSFSENLPGLGGVDFAAKPGNQPKAGSPNQQPSAPGRVQPQPATGNTPSQQPSPGTAPQQQDPAANADLPWTANQNFGQLPPELRLTPQYGFIGPYFACTLDGVAGNVVSPSHPPLLSAPLSNILFKLTINARLLRTVTQDISALAATKPASLFTIALLRNFRATTTSVPRDKGRLILPTLSRKSVSFSPTSKSLRRQSANVTKPAGNTQAAPGT